ncbi:cytochrome c biogenesis protein ResB [Thermodesulforhabdus norvegica]|uniref:Cytochrome c biogenesis protein n=1 Tax=Thermodesulforhabdus norvegica TaxID=39841 RepID=A0A1I4SAB7_9BACT|nr:cytochrome c biogenesis protein ResB [Thermodesulforhabdus norvegica]SFM61291.1 cytochrome c biogenesis protein [Thermodesulforhabdus norvegica]
MRSLLRSFYSFCISLRCAILLLIIIAVASCIGTLVPQGMPDEAVKVKYGADAFLTKIITAMNFNDVYHSLWFRAVLAALALNLILCTLERLPGTLRLWSHKETNITPERIKKFGLFETIASTRNFDDTLEESKRTLSERFGGRLDAVYRQDNLTGFSLSKGKLSLFTVYGIHASIILILFGALIGSILGFRGIMNIPEGEAERIVRIFGKDRAIRLPYEIKCEKFTVEFYPQGTPKEYRSEVVVLENQREVARAHIRVNEPFTYRGITFYQASYGSILEEAAVTFRDETGGQSYRVVLGMNRSAPLGDTGIVAHLVDFREDFSGFGPALGIVLTGQGKEPEGSWILARFPKFHGNRINNFRVVVEEMKTRFYTGLQVKRDPGVGIVIAGFCAFALFLLATYLWSYKRIWVVVEERNPGSVVYIAARSSKNTLAFESEFRELVSSLRERLETREDGGVGA